MAPYVAESARSTQSKPARPAPVVPRIVPAVPLAFSRTQATQRPITPEENGLGPTVTRADEQEPIVEDKISEEQDLTGGNPPLTPDSKVSGLSNQGREDATPDQSAESVVESVHEEQQDTLDAPSAVQDQQETTQVNSQAPLTDRPKTDLPPPFYPSGHASTPTSATSSNLPPFQPPQNNIPMHHPRPSASSIVFGGFADSSNTSPAPPAGLMGYPPPPPPGFVPGNYALPSFFAPSHSHHPSDPNAHMVYSSMGMPPPPPPGYRRNNMSASAQPWYPPGVQVSYSGPPVESFSSRYDNGYLNGGFRASRSPSQASTHTQDGDFRQRLDQNGERLVAPVPNASHAPPESSHELATYLLSLFGSQEFADHILEVAHPTKGAHISLVVHGAIISRSPILSDHLKRDKDSPKMQDGLKVINLTTRDRYINTFALTEVVKYLYGMPLPSPSLITQGLPPFDNSPDGNDFSTEARLRMDQSLSYVAAGFFLALPTVCQRGTEIAKALLRWDTLESALTFSLDGGLAPIFLKEGEPNASPDQHGSQNSGPTYEPYSTSLLLAVIESIVYNFPVTFSLNTTAPHLAENPLLPTYVESRPPTHNPRLSKIRFGDVPVEETSRPNFVTTMLSSLLLSVPFSVLQHIFGHYSLGARLDWSTIAKIMQDVVEERESRRKKALKSHSKAATQQRSDEHLVENLYWEEYIEPSSQHSSGSFINRRRTSDVTVSQVDQA